MRSDVPALLIAGALDPATPPDSAQAAAKELTRSQVVVIESGTHGTGSPCVDGVVARFVSTAQKGDASCVGEVKLPPFRVGVP